MNRQFILKITDIIITSITYIIQNPLESILVIISLWTIVLDTKEKILARILTFPKVLLCIYVYTNKRLYAKVLYSIIYGIINTYGYYRWQSRSAAPKLKIRKTCTKSLITFMGSGCIGALLFGKILSRYPAATCPYLDAFNAVFSLIEKWYLMNKKLERWPLAGIRVTIYAITCYKAGAVMLCLLHIIEAILAVHGYFKWKKSYLADNPKP